MDDGELDFLNHDPFLGAEMDELPSNCSMDSFFDDIFNDTHACTHTHTCNPPGPTDDSHTHTCFHVHTKIVPASSENKTVSDESAESAEKETKKRPLGNREAVRKYREKKKARAASLEDEVVRLRAVNQQLMKKLQSQGALEAEIVRLKCLLVDIRGRIQGEIGSFPYQKSATNLSSGYVVNPCNVQCDDQIYCLRSGMEAKIAEGTTLKGDGYNGCEFETLQCAANTNSELKALSGCELENNAPTANKKKGARVATAG